MTNENNTPTNCAANITSQNILSVSGDSRARSNSISGPLSNNRRGSTFNLTKQQSIDSQADFSINDGDNIIKEDLINLYDRINEISKDNFLMSIDEIIQELQKDQEDIATILIDRFSSQEWDTRSDDGHSFLTIAIQRSDEDNINYLLGYMKEELILHDAAKQGKSEPLKIIVNFLKNQLKLERVINKKDRYGKTPLHCAAQSGSQECFKLLLKEGARFSDDIYNRSELHFVAQSGNIKFLDYLRNRFKKKGIFQFENEIHKKDKYGNNLLHYAAKSGNKKCIERIIGDHIAFTANDNGDTPLHHIANIGTIENEEQYKNAVAFLIDKIKTTLMVDISTVVNQSNKEGYTSTHLAAINGNTAYVKISTDQGAKIDKANALYYAAIYGHSETVKELLCLCKDKNIRHENNRTLTHLAAMSGNKDCLEFVIEKFPDDINVIDDSGNTPLHLAAQFSDKKCLELLMEEMKSRHINPSEELFKKNENDKTAIDLATLGGNVECLEYFIDIIKQKKYGIEKDIKDVLNQQDENGEMLLHLAILSGSIECFDLITEKMESADIEIKELIRGVNKRRNLLHLAALSGNKECASVLIELIKKQFDVVDQALCHLVERDINGNAIFHMAAISGNKECIEYFAERTKLVLDVNLLYPVDVNEKMTSRNNYGETPLHLASMCFNGELIQFLCEPMEKAGILTEQINMQSRSGKTPLHYIVTDDNELKSAIIQKKREENQCLKKKAIKSLLYIKKGSGKEVINSRIDFDIRDDNGKTALDYVLNNSDTNIMQLFLHAFYELKDKSEQKYHKLEKKDQKRHKWISRVNSILSSTAGIIVTSLILTGMSNTPEKVAASCVAVFCSCVAISLVFLNCYLERKENKLKSKIQSDNAKIDQIEKRIEEITGESKKGYRTERERDELLQQIVKMLNIHNGTENINNGSAQHEEGVDQDQDIETTDTNEQAARRRHSTFRCVAGSRVKPKILRQNAVRTSVLSQGASSLGSEKSRSRTSITFTFTDYCDQANDTVEITNTRSAISEDDGRFRLRTRSDLSHCRKVGVPNNITGVNSFSHLSIPSIQR